MISHVIIAKLTVVNTRWTDGGKLVVQLKCPFYRLKICSVVRPAGI